MLPAIPGNDDAGPPAGGVASAPPLPVRELADLPGPRGLPLLGNLLQIEVGQAHRILARWADEFGPIYRFRMAGRQAVAVAAPELINEVLRERPGRFQRVQIMRNAMHDLGIDGVFSAEGSAWRRQRKLAMFALNIEHLRRYFPRLDAVTLRLQRRWERAAAGGEPVDAQRDLMRFTVDATSGLAFGTDLNTLEEEGDTIQQHLNKVFPVLARRVFAPFPYWRWIRFPVDREVDAAMKKVLVLVNRLVTAARTRAASPGAGVPASFLDALVAAQADDAGGFTDAEIVGNTVTMLLAGEDTTANSLAWLMHIMAEHPDVQARMRDEADRVLAGVPRAPDYAATEALRYIEAVALETMRVLPVSPLQGAQPIEDTVIGGVRLPKGTAIYLLAAHAASSSANFSEARTFEPQRWLDHGQKAGSGHNTHAFVPFGAGPRFCPGRHLAMLEMKMVAAMLSRNFEVSRAPESAVPEQVFSFTMMPRNLRLSLRLRTAGR
jgi:cytochrome P450